MASPKFIRLPNGIYIVAADSTVFQMPGTNTSPDPVTDKAVPNFSGVKLITGISCDWNILTGTYNGFVHIQVYGGPIQYTKKFDIVGNSWTDISNVVASLLA